VQLGPDFAHILTQDQPPELSLVHEELVTSCASVSQEFPTGTIPADRRSDTAEQPGTLRARAIRIRGSGESAYPFVKGAATAQVAALGQVGPATLQSEARLQVDPQGLEE